MKTIQVVRRKPCFPKEAPSEVLDVLSASSSSSRRHFLLRALMCSVS
jgi:hypothetical protein